MIEPLLAITGSKKTKMAKLSCSEPSSAFLASLCPKQRRRPMKPGLFKVFSAFSILILIATSQSHAQTVQRDNRSRTASISGRVTVAGKPAVNAAITIVETDLKSDGAVAADGLDNRIPFLAKTRTDGDGRYLVTGLAEGRYVVSAVLKAFIVIDGPADPAPSRTVTLDEGEARGKVDFALIRGGVITGKVTDDKGRPLLAKRVQLYTLDEQGRKRAYQGPLIYEMSETDDRGVYRIYGLPLGRYIISAGGEGGGDPLRGVTRNFARTYHPDATDEKQAKVIEIKEESEVVDVDIRFGSAEKTYEAMGRVVDRETGKPVPRVRLLCVSKPEKDRSYSSFSTTAIVDGQGNFRLAGLPTGRYHVKIIDILSGVGYVGDIAEFEITNDNVSGIEVKAFLGASVSGVVVIEGGDAAARKQLQAMTIYPSVSPPSNATDAANGPSSIPPSIMPAWVNADGSFTIKGLQAGSVGFRLASFSSSALRIRRIERDGVEVKDAIEVGPGEKIVGVRIVVFQANGRIRGQVQIVGGELPDGWRFEARASRTANADELKAGVRRPVIIDRAGGSAFVDEKGRFVIERLAAGEYDLLVYPTRRTGEGRWSSVNSPGSNQRVIVRENDETSVTISFDPNRKNQEDR
jgi:hypothetical protein